MFLEVFLFLWSNIYIIIATLLSTIVYYGVIRNWNYFNDRKIAFKRGIPMIASNYKFFIGTEDFQTDFLNYYNQFPNNRFCGLYELHKPLFMIRDPKLIKQITVKDFDHFANHRGNIDIHADPLLGRSLFFLKNHEWREMRTTLSPAFTGSKMRMMFDIVVNVIEGSMQKIKEKIDRVGDEMEIKQLMSRISTDIISAASFGLETDSIEDSDMYRHGKIVTNFDGLQGMKFIGFASIPNIMRAFGITLFTEEVRNYFRSAILGSMRHREESKIHKPDMINILIEAKRGTLKYTDDGKSSDLGFATVEESSITRNGASLKHWSDDDLVAQCMQFFFAGFDSVSTALNFMCYEICVNDDIQDRLYNECVELKNTLEEEQRNMKYEDVQKMKFMDMVMSEALRRYPPAQANDRVCTKPYKLEDYDGNTVTLEKGDSIWIPTYCIHNDPKYWEDPMTFNPERFSDENKHKINPDAYFPFGSGPRNCIGSRFALMEVKAIIYYLLLNFRLERCERTQIPIKFKKGTFNVATEFGLWIKLAKRI